MIGNAPKSPITGVPGWLTNAEEETLVKYAKLVKPGGTIVNIGCEYGRSLIALAKAAPQCLVKGIELSPKPELSQNIAEAQVQNAVVHQRDSQKIETHDVIQHAEIDYVFIDGDHFYEGVTRDIAVWSPAVKVGGYVLFHDVAQETNKLPHYLHFEVAKAVAEWQEAVPDEFRLVETVDTIAVYQRVNTPTQKEEPKPATKAATRKPSRKRSTSKS